MSYPADPLDVVVEIAPGSDPATDPAVYNWVDISQYWRTGTSAITISRGRQSPLSDTVPSQCSLVLDNTDGRFSSRNPIGAYYPDLQRNTPLRVRLRHPYDMFGRTVESWGTALNANPYIESTASPWTVTGGTVARSTTQFHEGSASLLLTPDGVTATPEVRSENASGVVALQRHRASAWLRCAVARSVNINIVWRTSGGTFISSAGAVSVSVAAGTWTPIEVIGVAPATAAQAQISVSMGSTPPGSHTLHIDEATLQLEAGGWGASDAGEPWSTSGGSASDYSVTDGVGRHSVGSVNVLRTSLIDTGLTTHHVSVDVTLPVVPSGAGYTLWVVGRAADLNNYYAARLDVATSGSVELKLLTRDGGALSAPLDTASLGTHTAGQTWRVVFDVAGQQLRAKAWRFGVDFEPDWQVEATDTSLTAGTQVGVLTRAETGNTNGTQEITWDNFDVSSTRFVGYVDRWPSRWDTTGNNRWVPITAHGTLRRISTAGDATRSPLYRYLTEQQPSFMVAYWPMEDGPSATEPTSEVDGVGPMSPSAPVRFGQSSPSAGVGTMVDTSGAYLHARIPARYAVDWRVECVVAHDAVPATTVRVLSWLTPGTIQRWDLNTTPTGFRLLGWTAVTGGTEVITVDTGDIAQPNQLHHLRVDVTLSGTTVTAVVYVDGVSSGSDTSGSSSALQPTVLRVNPDAASDDVPAVGHVAVWAASPLPSTDSADAALGNPGEEAHARIEAVCGERGVPYTPVTTATLTSEAMGPRPSGSLVALLRECEATDGGILFELTSGHLSYRPRSLLYNQTVALALDYEQGHVAPPFEPSDDDAQLRNDVTARRPSGSEARFVDDEHVAAVGRYETAMAVNPQDDSHLKQTAAWAVHRGTVAEQRFDAIAMHMARVGATVIGQWLSCDIGSRIAVSNVPAELTPDDVDVILAGYTETIGYPRAWVVEMVCEPASAWTVGELDDLVLGRLDTAGSQLVAGDSAADARVTDSTFGTDYIVIATSDDGPFSIGDRCVLHGPDGRRKEPTVFTITNKTSGFGFTNLFLSPPPAEQPQGDLAGTLDSVRRVDETSLSVSTTTGPVWTTNAGHVPFDVNIAGERITVTAVSGASSPQTFTVTRAVNAVEKGHPAGTDVRLWQPLILGL